LARSRERAVCYLMHGRSNAVLRWKTRVRSPLPVSIGRINCRFKRQEDYFEKNLFSGHLRSSDSSLAPFLL